MSLELIRWLANQLRLSLLEADSDGTLRGNVHALERLGTQRVTSLAGDAQKLIDAKDTAELEDAIAVARSGTEVSFEPRPGVQVLAVPTGGDGVALLITSQESPVPKSVQAKAAAADLAAGVSHEVANALSAIVGWAQVARERPDKAPPEEALSLIEKSAQVARDATQDLLRMVRHTNHERSRTNPLGRNPRCRPSAPSRGTAEAGECARLERRGLLGRRQTLAAVFDRLEPCAPMRCRWFRKVAKCLSLRDLAVS